MVKEHAPHRHDGIDRFASHVRMFAQSLPGPGEKHPGTMEIHGEPGACGQAGRRSRALECVAYSGLIYRSQRRDSARAHLEGANLERANLTGVDLLDSNLSAANLRSADLSGRISVAQG